MPFQLTSTDSNHMLQAYNEVDNHASLESLLQLSGLKKHLSAPAEDSPCVQINLTEDDLRKLQVFLNNLQGVEFGNFADLHRQIEEYFNIQMPLSSLAYEYEQTYSSLSSVTTLPLLFLPALDSSSKETYPADPARPLSSTNLKIGENSKNNKEITSSKSNPKEKENKKKTLLARKAELARLGRTRKNAI